MKIESAIVNPVPHWLERIDDLDRSWLRIRLPLLVIALSGLLYAYLHFPHRGAEPVASRYQTLVLAVQGAGAARTAYGAYTNLDYLRASYEDPGIYWLVNHAIAAAKLFRSSFSPTETIIYPLQFLIFALALVALNWRLIPLNISFAGTAVFFFGFAYQLLFWSWDVYWAPALAVLLTLTFLLSVTAWHQRGLRPWLAAAIYGLFVGFLGLIRQDSGLIAQAAAFGVVLSLLLYGIPLKRNDSAMQPHLRAAMLVFCFIAATTLPRFGYVADLNLIEWIERPPQAVRVNMEHGKWHNVYLGIGFNVPPYALPSNVYGIAWDDTVGAFHAAEEDPTARFGTPGYMPTLRALVTKIILDDPIFYAKTVVARSRYELSMIVEMVRPPRLLYVFYLWPLLSLTLFLRAGRRAFDGLTYIITAVAALAPPVLTFPSAAYSTAIGMAVLGAPLFFLGSLCELSANSVHFSLLRTRRLVVMVISVLVAGTVLIAFLALRARMANDQLLGNLVGQPSNFLVEVESDPWRVDRHFNHSLSAVARKTAVLKFAEAYGQVSNSPDSSITYFKDDRLRIINVTRLPGRIIFLVESNIELDYGIFVLSPVGSNSTFFRKALDWSPGQTYLLIFNTGPLDKTLEDFTLALKDGTTTFTPEPNTPVATIAFGRSKGALTLSNSQGPGQGKIKIGWNLIPKEDNAKDSDSWVLSRAANGTLDFPISGWKPDGTTEMISGSSAPRVRTPPGRSAYATFYEPLEADQSGTLEFELRYQLISGRISFGLLTADRSHWLPTTAADNNNNRYFVKLITLHVGKGEHFVPLITNNHPDGDLPSAYSIVALRCYFTPDESN